MAYQRLDESLIKEWNWEKNSGLDPRKLNVKAKTKLWWICDKGHSWQDKSKPEIKKCAPSRYAFFYFGLTESQTDRNRSRYE